MPAYEVYKETARRLSIEVRKGTIEALDRSLEKGTAVRFVDKGMGFVSSTDPGLSEEKLIEMARSAALASDLESMLPAPQPLPNFSSDISAFSKMNTDEKVDLARNLEAEVLKYDHKIKTVRKSVYEEEIKEIQIKNSNGINVSAASGISLLRVTAVAEENGGSEWATEVRFSLDPGELDPKKVAADVADRAVSYLGSKKIASCKCPCIFDSHVSKDLIAFIAPAFFADSIYKQKSPFAKSMGRKIYSPAVSLVNDGTLEGGFSSAPFDAEGSPAQKTVVVQNGELKSFLSDTSYAAKLRCRPTSSSVRSKIMQMPSIGLHNFYILSGDLNLDGLKKKMGKGLYITDVLGLHMANHVTGDFSIGVAGQWIEKGKAAYSVGGVTIAGNLHDIFGKVLATGDDLKFWYSTGSPSLLIEEISVSGG